MKSPRDFLVPTHSDPVFIVTLLHNVLRDLLFVHAGYDCLWKALYALLQTSDRGVTRLVDETS